MAKLLIICYTFPPYNGIGGRRWAKYCKYLLKKSIDFEVIAALRKGKGSNWINDTALYKEKVTFLESGYPKVLATIPKTIWDKLAYRIFLFREKHFSSGNYYDQSKYWKNTLVPAVEERIKKGTDTIIYSMPPFRGSYFLLPLKMKYPHVQFILDARDPWSNNRTSFGFDSLPEKNIKSELEMEKDVVRTFDKILSVADNISDYLANQHKVSKEKFFALNNGFDIDEIQEPNNDESKVKSIVFVGTFYQKAKQTLVEFVDAIESIGRNHPNLLDNISFDFYGVVPDYFNDATAKIACITHHGTVSSKMAGQKIANASAAMLFLVDDTNYSFSTKFYEYASNRKPILVFSKPGKTSRFVNENKIGMQIAKGNIMQDLLQLLEKLKNNELHFNSSFSTKEFELDFLTDRLIEIIEHDT